MNADALRQSELKKPNDLPAQLKTERKEKTKTKERMTDRISTWLFRVSLSLPITESPIWWQISLPFG